MVENVKFSAGTVLLSAATPTDLWIGLLKGLVLGLIVGIVSSWEGLRATGGPIGVGRATNAAIVRSMVAVCCGNLALTAIFYGALAEHPGAAWLTGACSGGANVRPFLGSTATPLA